MQPSAHRPQHTPVERQFTLSGTQRRAIAAVLAGPRTSLYLAMLATVPAYIGVYVGTPEDILNNISCRQHATSGQVCSGEGIGHLLFVIVAFVLTEGAFAVALRRIGRIWREADRGKVMSVTGQITWTRGRRRGRLVPVVPGQRIRVLYLPTDSRFHLYGGSVDCPPGTYQLSYLPRIGVLVESEWCDSTDEHAAAAGTQAALAQIFNFLDADVAANRAGRLSKRQRWRLRRARVGASLLPSPPLLFVLLLLGSGISFCGTAVLVIYRMATMPVAVQVLTIFSVWGAFLLLAVTVWRIRRLQPDQYLRKLRGDLRAGTVAMVEGLGRRSYRKHVSVEKGFEMTDLYYSYAIGEQEFDLPFRAWYNACLTGMFCRAYYAPHSRQLLSFEEVSFPALRSRVWRLGEDDEEEYASATVPDAEKQAQHTE